MFSGLYESLHNQPHARLRVDSPAYLFLQLTAPNIVRRSRYHQVEERTHFAEPPSSQFGDFLNHPTCLHELR